MDLVRLVLSVMIPPLGVFLQVGLTKHFWINVILTILGYISRPCSRGVGDCEVWWRAAHRGLGNPHG